MKKLIIGVLGLLSLSSFSMEVTKIDLDSELNLEGDEAFLLSNPSLDTPSGYSYNNTGRVYFSENSSDKGVCVGLGYERNAPLSIILQDELKNSRLTINVKDDGKVQGVESNAKIIKQIVCINKRTKPQIDATLFKTPRAPGGWDTYYSAEEDTSPKGICFQLGYTNTTHQGILPTESNYDMPLLKVDPEGKILSAAQSSVFVDNILCVQ